MAMDKATNDRNENQGEGNRRAARRYNRAAERFAESGEVEKREEDNRNPENVQELRDAEQEAHNRTK